MAPERPRGTAPLPTRGLVVGAAALVCTGALVLAALLVGAPQTSARPAAADVADRLVLPGAVAGLGASTDPDAAEALDRLAEQLRRDPAVATVSARAYRDDEVDLVVLLLTPQRPLDDQTAGRLTSEVLGAAGSRRGMSSDFRSVTTEDGEALVTCSTPDPATSTCLAVEADRALLVMVSGEVLDPVTTTVRVRDDLDRLDDR